MRTKVKLEPQVKATYSQLSADAHEYVRDCLHMLELGKPIPSEVPIKLMPNCAGVWLQAGHILVFQRKELSRPWGVSMLITIKHITYADEWIVREYLKTQEPLDTVANIAANGKDILDNAQRITFSIQVTGVLVAVVLSLLAVLGPFISSTTSQSAPSSTENVERPSAK